MTTRPRKPAPGTPAPGKLPLTELAELKARRQPIAMVTAYDAPSGRLADAAGADIILVGDSAAMTVLGHDSTVPATMDEMIVLTRAVNRGARRPLVVADMPFGSFQVSDEEALHNAIRFVKEAGADAVKLEGAGPMLSRVQALVGAGIPVMGHIGLTPQSATMLGGFKAQGRTAEKAVRLYEDALALEAAGCFAIVLEAVPAPVAARITEALTVPTIGIGAGVECDGQVLVWHDLLGLYEGRSPRFVKQYADLATEIGARRAYVDDVRERRFPEEQHTYAMPEEELEPLRGGSRRSYENAARKRATSASAASERHHVQPWTARTPTTSRTPTRGRSRAASASRKVAATPSSEPPRRKTSAPKAAIWRGQTTKSESATGVSENASTWRARRNEPALPRPRTPR